jgi:hypothetical protein
LEEYNERDHGGDVVRCFVIEATKQNCRLSGWDDGGHAGHDSLLDSELTLHIRVPLVAIPLKMRTGSDAKTSIPY